VPVNVVTVENVAYSYNAATAISDVSFYIEQGDYLGIVGPNGSGKSTLIKIILGILPLQTGSVSLFDTPLSGFGHWDRIGYLPQKLSALNTHFPGSVREIVEMGRRNSKKNENTQHVLDLMGIRHLAGRLIGELSYGEQQRAMLARTLVNRPELLIFDEPTTALDPETRDTFYSLTKDLNRAHGTTIVLITHDIGTIGRYARRLLYLDKKIVFAGTFQEFCASRDMTGFFGEKSQHIICHQHDVLENSK